MKYSCSGMIPFLFLTNYKQIIINYIIYLNYKLCLLFTNFFILSYKCALGYHILR